MELYGTAILVESKQLGGFERLYGIYWNSM